MSTVTMQDLELETAELLPARETLCVPKCGSHGHGSSVSVTQLNGSANGNGDGNGFIPILSGDLDGNLSGNNIIL
jgi:hypothetical protein